MGVAKWALAACFVSALACGRSYDEQVTDGVTDAGHDVDVSEQPDPGVDASSFEAGPSGDAADGGNGEGGDGGSTVPYAVLGSGIDDPAQLAVDAVNVYFTLGRRGEVRRCSKTNGCAGLSELVAAGQSVLSGLAVTSANVYWATGYRYIERCGTAGTMPCTPTMFVDTGASSYPSAPEAHGTRLYWFVFSGNTRKLQTCPLSGCTSGYPKTIFSSVSGDALDGAPIVGMEIDNNNHVFVLRYTGGIVRLTMTGAEAIDATSITVINGTPFTSTGLDLDGTTLRWTIGNGSRVDQCTAPSCTTVTTFASGHLGAVDVASDTVAVYGADQGASDDAGSPKPDAGSLWRMLK